MSQAPRKPRGELRGAELCLQGDRGAPRQWMSEALFVLVCLRGVDSREPEIIRRIPAAPS